MAGKDYNHLFKLLIIGDSSQYFSLHFRVIHSLYEFIKTVVFCSFTFFYYSISHNATGLSIFIARRL